MEFKENITNKNMNNDKRATDDFSAKEEAMKVYTELLDAMIHKSEKRMQALLADSFTVNLMSLLNLNKRGFINAITGGTLKVYAVEQKTTEVKVNGNKATVLGRSVADAAIIGQGRKHYQMQLECKVAENGIWQMTECKAKFTSL